MRHHNIYTVYAALFIFILLSCSASADLLVTKAQDSENIFPAETAEFDITIKNTGNIRESVKFVILATTTDWDFLTSPAYNTFDINPGESVSINILIKARDFTQLNFRQYNLPYRIESQTTGRQHNNEFSIFVRDPDKYYGYRPSLNVVAQLDTSIDPRKATSLVMLFDNKNPLNITDLRVDIRSEVEPANNRVETISIPPLGKTSEAFDIMYDPLQAPAKDKITVRVSIPALNWTMDPIVRDIEIRSYTNLESSVLLNSSLLKTVETREFLNDGNVGTVKTVLEEITIFKQLFISTQPAAEVIKQDGKRYLHWDLSIGPQQTASIQITRNFRPLFVILTLGILALIVYLILRSPILVKKESQATRHKDAETELSSIKVMIHVKNRSAKILDNITVVDRLPPIAVLEDRYAMGTMKPEKIIRNEKTGTMIKWQIPSLEPYEERIITYNISPKLKIVGGLNLKPAMVKFRGKFGTFSRVYSNRVSAR